MSEVLFPRERRRRLLHAGLDFGTAWSKVVIRDHTANAWVVTDEGPYADVTDFRFPSIVGERSGALVFGRRVHREACDLIHTSVKMHLVDKCLYGTSGAQDLCPPGIAEEDLAVLVVVFLLQAARRSAAIHCEARGLEPGLTMTLGVPMTPWRFDGVAEAFTRVALRARHLALELDGEVPDLTVEDLDLRLAVELLDRARVPGEGFGPEKRGLIRAEVGAALQWPVMSPEVDLGLHAVVDIGAGTTNTSVFRINGPYDRGTLQWQKDWIHVFGASCGAPAVDALVEAVGWETGGLAELKRPDSVRASFREVKTASRVLDRIDHRRREAFLQGWKKEQNELVWSAEEFQGVWVIGGGSRFRDVRKVAVSPVWASQRRSFREARLRWPTDLEWAGVAPSGVGLGSAPRTQDVLVAYGLSFLENDVVQIEDPEKIDEYAPDREPSIPGEDSA